MFSPTLDAWIPQDHPVRLFDEILRGCDWSDWECHYSDGPGQPAIHPRIMAGAIWYGLSLGIRSSRQLERACSNSVDFMWLVECRKIDHSTFCSFRTQFAEPLKELFRQIGRIAMKMELIRLNQVALDGTRVQANSSRHGTASAKTIEQRLAELDEQIEQMMAESEAQDKQEDLFHGQASTPNRLPRELGDAKKRQAKLRQALERAEQADARRGEGERPASVPVADPDATVQPNKEGGHAPNYCPMVAADGQTGMIVAADVLPDSNEAGAAVPMIDRIEQTLGEKPQQLLADSAYASGTNLAALQERNVEAFIPVPQREDRPDNPARREDPTQPVPQSDWPRLPRNTRTKKLDRAAFIYDPKADGYHCPMGHTMSFVKVQDKYRKHPAGLYKLYRCDRCPGCELASQCFSGQAEYRTIYRDEHEDLREAMDKRLATDEGHKTYARRSWINETVFAHIKAHMHIRQFLLRGLSKVQTEWLWACVAYNLCYSAKRCEARDQAGRVLQATVCTATYTCYSIQQPGLNRPAGMLPKRPRQAPSRADPAAARASCRRRADGRFDTRPNPPTQLAVRHNFQPAAGEYFDKPGSGGHTALLGT